MLDPLFLELSIAWFPLDEDRDKPTGNPTPKKTPRRRKTIMEAIMILPLLLRLWGFGEAISVTGGSSFSFGAMNNSKTDNPKESAILVRVWNEGNCSPFSYDLRERVVIWEDSAKEVWVSPLFSL